MRQNTYSDPDRDEYETNQLFRFRTVLSSQVLLLRACEVPVRAGNRSLPRLIAFGGFSFTSNRVVPGHRMGGPSRDEGMATGNATHTACLKSCSQVALIAKAGRCNTGRRNESSVGNGNHCARVFKREAKRPTVVCVEITRNTKSLLNRLRGGFAHSLPPIVLNQTVHDN